jgi:type 1 fimbria pilin
MNKTIRSLAMLSLIWGTAFAASAQTGVIHFTGAITEPTLSAPPRTGDTPSALVESVTMHKVSAQDRANSPLLDYFAAHRPSRAGTAAEATEVVVVYN